jgi:hypothetical protein
MSEPTQGLPTPAGQPEQGISTPGQPPTPPQTPAPNTPPAPGTVTPPAAPPQPGPDLAKIQRERDEAIAYSRQLQSERDRLKAAIAGPAQVDPMVGRIKAYTDNGYSEQDARFFISQIDSAVGPLQQQNQQLQAALEGQTRAQQAYQQAIDANPDLYADPRIQQATWNALNEAALAGNLNMVSPNYAYSVAAGAWAELNQPWKKPTGTPAPAPQPFRPAGVMQFGGNGGSYAPNAQHQQQQAPDPAEQAMADRMAQRWAGKPISDLK